MASSVEEAGSLSENSLNSLRTQQERVCKKLKIYSEYLQSEDLPSENKRWIALKTLNVILSFLSSKAYVSGCKEAFPNREYVAYVTAFCSAVTSALPTLWAGFNVIDSAKPDVLLKKELLDLEKNFGYYTQHIAPSFLGVLAAIPFAGLTAKSSTGGTLSTILWTLNSWCVNAALTVFAMQNLMVKVPRKLVLSKEDEDIAYKVRDAFLKRLKSQQWRVVQGDFNDSDFTFDSLLKDTEADEDPRWLWRKTFSWIGKTVAGLGLVGYSSVDFSFLDSAFTIPFPIIDVTTKVVLTASSMVPFAWLFLNGATEVFSSIYAIAESLYDGRFGELIAKNPGYRFYSKAAVIGTVTLLTMAALSGVTNGNMTRELATAFFEKISFGTVHIPTALADFFGADAYSTSAMFNGSGSIFGAYLPALAALARYCFGCAESDPKSALKLDAFNTFYNGLAEMALEDIMVLINSLPTRDKDSIVEEAYKGLKSDRWASLIYNIEEGFGAKRDPEKDTQSDANTEANVTLSPAGSINSTNYNDGLRPEDLSDIQSDLETTLLPKGDSQRMANAGESYGSFFDPSQATVPPSKITSEQLENSASCKCTIL